MATITAVVPTLNRPKMLHDALCSLRNQSMPPDEIIVVDDGSTPAVNGAALIAEFGPQVRVLRNQQSRGLAFGRNWGAEEARCKYVVHLDDDDLLAPSTLEEAHKLLEADNGLEIVFLGVKGFGPRAEHFNRVQPEAIRKVCDRAPGSASAPGLVYFDRGLMRAMLKAVPSAFQHTVTSRDTWKKVTALRLRAYQCGTGAKDLEEAKALITGQLRDSEWALYAAAACNRTVLINEPRYLARCEGQNLSSKPANVEKHLIQNLAIRTQLYRAASLPPLAYWKEPIRESLAVTQADAAYHYFLQGYRTLAWKHAWQSLNVRPSFARLRLVLRIWLPRANHVEP